ncbi:porin, partial [Pseudidiomarina aestuarii]
MLHNKLQKSLIASAVLGAIVSAPVMADEGPTWKFSGYVKLDAFASDYGDGTAPASG